MKARAVAMLGLAALAAQAWADDEMFDRLDEALTFHSADSTMRARVSGTLDLEGYQFTAPAPGVIESEGTGLFNPRLTMFLDAQLGEKIYAFAQARVDRGFDPSDEPMEARLDEYAVRLTPWADGRLTVQAGKFATVVGNWVARHGSWENPFVTAPLPYEHLTGVWDAAAATSASMLFFWAHVLPVPPRGETAADKYLRLPIIWGPSYTTGVAVSGEAGFVNYALEMKDASLSSRPERWEQRGFNWDEPTVSGRLGYRPSPMWDFGLSASTGPYLTDEARPTVPPGRAFGDYRETVLGQDIGFAWHHLQVWAECYEAKFAIPKVGDAKTVSYYVEVRYKLTPQLFAAVRWNEQVFARLPDGAGGGRQWGADVWRIDFAPTYRLTPHIQLKLQYSLQHDDIVPEPMSHLGALQLVVRF